MPDFVRRFFVSCAKISEAYVDEILVRLTESRPQKQVQERLREDITPPRFCAHLPVLTDDFGFLSLSSPKDSLNSHSLWLTL